MDMYIEFVLPFFKIQQCSTDIHVRTYIFILMFFNATILVHDTDVLSFCNLPLLMGSEVFSFAHGL